MAEKNGDGDLRVIATNRRARHEYWIEETHEAGIALTGTEVKSLRAGHVILGDAFARVDRGEAWLLHLHISPYEQGNIQNHDPMRTRKLLLHKREIMRLGARVQQRGYTLVPLRLYFRNGVAKVELGLARGRHTYDKRERIAERDAERRIARSLGARDAGRGPSRRER
ncbi:MAG TPA: SsrA-binding protein SmpB [bacterium]|nr:SsrA-binding protein SmpB [bacterium]